MHILVQTGFGQSLELEVEPQDTIEAIMSQTSSKLKLPPGEQQFVFKGKVLESGKALADLEVKDGSKLQLAIVPAEESIDISISISETSQLEGYNYH